MRSMRILLLTTLTLCLLACCGIAAAETLTLPADVTAIEEQAFYADASLDQVVLPEGLQTIGSKASRTAGNGCKPVRLAHLHRGRRL